MSSGDDKLTKLYAQCLQIYGENCSQCSRTRPLYSNSGCV